LIEPSLSARESRATSRLNFSLSLRWRVICSFPASNHSQIRSVSAGEFVHSTEGVIVNTKILMTALALSSLLASTHASANICTSEGQVGTVVIHDQPQITVQDLDNDGVPSGLYDCTVVSSGRVGLNLAAQLKCTKQDDPGVVVQYVAKDEVVGMGRKATIYLFNPSNQVVLVANCTK
jgi:hypothetical protein